MAQSVGQRENQSLIKVHRFWRDFSSKPFGTKVSIGSLVIHNQFQFLLLTA